MMKDFTDDLLFFIKTTNELYQYRNQNFIKNII
jgi:hypothetical protein